MHSSTSNNMVEIPPRRVYVYRMKLYFMWKWKYYLYPNQSLGGLWHNFDEWSVFVGFRSKGDKWFERDHTYYDGHTTSSVTIFGIVFGKMYAYMCDRLAETL